MLIQNVSNTASAPRPTSNSEPTVVAVPKQAELPQVAAKTTPQQQLNSAPPTITQVKNAVDSINKAMKQTNSNLEFSVDKETNKTIIKVVESRTGEVIRQFPSEEVLAISRAIDNMQQGLLIKQEA